MTFGFMLRYKLIDKIMDIDKIIDDYEKEKLIMAELEKEAEKEAEIEAENENINHLVEYWYMEQNKLTKQNDKDAKEKAYIRQLIRASRNAKDKVKRLAQKCRQFEPLLNDATARLELCIDLVERVLLS
jgi:hypothetical protein